MRRYRAGCFAAIVVGLLLLLLTPVGTILDAPIALALWLVVGWIGFLIRVLPRVTWDAGGMATAVLCLALFAGGSHVFLCWIYREIQEGKRWSPRWTARLAAMVVVMFAAGISATGIVHQTGWLLTEKGPLFSSGEPARRAQSTNNLKQIWLGLRDYHEKERMLPPGGTFDAQGRPWHGWLTSLLPYVEQAELYNQINFETPWDDPENVAVFQNVVTTYRNPIVPGPLRDAEGRGLAHYLGNARVLGGDRPLSHSEITDGLANTIMAGEAAGSYPPWGYPANWRDPARGINGSPDGFGSPQAEGARVLFADGSVRFIRSTIDPKILRTLSTPAGGEPIAAGLFATPSFQSPGP